MKGHEIRKRFIDYFAANGHAVVRSSSLIPHDDPTLLFTNAGMVQFKRVFLGEEKRDYTRAVSSQKCVRAGGKHNDLENVGYTARHHTFFEMLGNFSFGDYFKKESIAFAWELLTRDFGLDPRDLWVSVFKDDDDAYDLWNKIIGVPPERIVRLGEADNFWAMGDTGPCGPCSEILIDRGPEMGCGRPDCRPGCDCDRYLEIWNLVFMEYNRDESGHMTPLPSPSIDTGMGLERIAAVLQGVKTNFETDLFAPIFDVIGRISQTVLGDDPEKDVAMKVIADHSRAAAFLIADGVLPSNDGRGYVLRRIMRRAIRYGRNLGLTRPFLHQTVVPVIECMRDAYPELAAQDSLIRGVVKNEEERFQETLDNGLKLLSDALERISSSDEKVIPGDLIFKLYDTYGFPVDIVKDVVRGKGFIVDEEGFRSAMEARKKASRTKVSFSQSNDAIREYIASKSPVPCFVGYDTLVVDSVITMLAMEGKSVDLAETGSRVDVICTKTPFYAESGGQVGDTGFIDGADFRIEIEDTLKDPSGIIVHKGRVISGRAGVGTSVTLMVDAEKRAATARNHTATHLLHKALREVLGDHVRQAGSMVSPDRLRFDFTHFSSLDAKEIVEIQRRVCAKIIENINVETRVMTMEEAVKSGAVALFEEKYGDTVRVVSIGDYSRELCGGTHAARTGDIGILVILSESSVASGVRRIEAVTGMGAVEQVIAWQEIISRCSDLLKSGAFELPARIESLLSEQKRQEKMISDLKLKIAALSAGAGMTGDDGGTREINGIKVIARTVEADSPAALRSLADRFKEKLGSGVVVLGARAGKKAMLVAGVTKDLTGRIQADKIIKDVAPKVGGGGGGRADMAQAGGSKPEGLDTAIRRVFDLVRELSG